MRSLKLAYFMIVCVIIDEISILFNWLCCYGILSFQNFVCYSLVAVPVVLWSVLNKWLCGFCGVGWLSSVHIHQYVSTHQHAITIITVVIDIIIIIITSTTLLIILISRINTRHTGISALIRCRINGVIGITIIRRMMTLRHQ